jgi:hypothetical protein
MKIVSENHVAYFPHQPSNKQQKATLETYNYHFDFSVFSSSSLPDEITETV